MVLCIASVCRYADHMDYIMNFGIAVSVSCLVILAFSSSGYQMKLLQTLGRRSMAPYVLHAYMSVPMRVILQKCGCRDFAVYALVETGSAVLLSLMVIKFMERFNWIEALFYPTRWKKTKVSKI